MTTIDAFPAIESKPNSLDAQSKANRDAWAPVLEQYEKNLQATTSEGTEISLKRHQARGQLLGMFQAFVHLWHSLNGPKKTKTQF